MFWSNKAHPSLEGLAMAEKCQVEAEGLYRSGKYHCAEAVLETVRRHFAPDVPESVVGTVSGFGGGSSSGCICGAVSGGTVALGLILTDKKATAHFTKELHTWFKQKYGVTCCKTIRQTHKGACPVLTGEVAGKIAEMLASKQEK
ncbi:MAG: C-GCAxxG-C-C family protein [Desulfuromonadaceae bacterium]|nr:C-GCAxxG-C-C family protein [Desulfuromonadaceae bacterium]MDD5107274.1 C-GCAxxG-C-C family protein [Desulfuromonadaceae bacterium]